MKPSPIPPYELTLLAKELNVRIRQLTETVDQLRNELYTAARAERAARKAKRALPKCGSRTVEGRKCTQPISPGEFRCTEHAKDLRLKRKASGKMTTPPQADEPAALSHEIPCAPARE